MTTVIRNGNMVYSDSCYGAPIGTERTRVFGEPKFFVNKNKTVLVAICGNIPGIETTTFLTDHYINVVEKYFSDWKNNSPHGLAASIESFYEQIMEHRPKLDDFYSLAFFIKDITIQVNVKMSKHVKRVRVITYGLENELVFGSGAPWWLAQNGLPDLTIPAKFKYIYRLDPNSGGTIGAFDLTKLKEIPNDTRVSNPG